MAKWIICHFCNGDCYLDNDVEKLCPVCKGVGEIKED